MELPAHGKTREQLRAEIQQALTNDADWRAGKTFSLVYFAGEEVAGVLRDAYSAAIFTNGLSPGAFKSLKKFESEVVAMTASLLGKPDAVGNMTSGGTESILMAVKTARDWARATRGITEPEMVAPVTAHPAFDKSAQYLGVKIVHTGLRDDLRADPAAMRRAVTPNTVLLVASAPNYPNGAIDPVPEIAALAQEHGIPCHVDACLGGFLLPFLERIGHPVKPWDFRVPGVSSISADCHKYGFAARGASTIIYRDAEYRRHQYFAVTDWPGGLYGSPTMTGSRPGGAIAAAWAVMQHLGQEGYERLARVMLDTTQAFQQGIRETEGLRIVGDPDATVFAFTSDTLDVHAVADALEAGGWHPDRQQNPASLHLMITPAHAEVAADFIRDLREAVGKVARGEVAGGGRAAIYGALDKMTERGPVRDLIISALERITRADGA